MTTVAFAYTRAKLSTAYFAFSCPYGNTDNARLWLNQTAILHCLQYLRAGRQGVERRQQVKYGREMEAEPMLLGQGRRQAGERHTAGDDVIHHWQRPNGWPRRSLPPMRRCGTGEFEHTTTSCFLAGPRSISGDGGSRLHVRVESILAGPHCYPPSGGDATSRKCQTVKVTKTNLAGTRDHRRAFRSQAFAEVLTRSESAVWPTAGRSFPAAIPRFSRPLHLRRRGRDAEPGTPRILVNTHGGRRKSHPVIVTAVSGRP